jgi:hypothetical protein
VLRERVAPGKLTVDALSPAGDCVPEEFKREVERHLTSNETEQWEMLYFKVCKSQLAVIEQVLEIAPLMLGGQKARSYCLKMICADFPAGAIHSRGEHSELGERNVGVRPRIARKMDPLLNPAASTHAWIHHAFRPSTISRSL